MDPAIDGHKNTLLYEESHTAALDETTNPNGNLYEIRKNVINRSSGLDAAPEHNRTFKIINPSKKNPHSGNPVSYKFMPPPTQKLLAAPGSIQEQRALFTKHHVWVTKYRENELYAAGRFTLQSQLEVGGVFDMAKRDEEVADEDIVVWNTFGLTHNPRQVSQFPFSIFCRTIVVVVGGSLLIFERFCRVEDWPVMPVDIFQVHYKPADFFERNPAIDVPSSRNVASVLVEKECCADKL
jgi:primary-amine oxidase